MASVTLAQPARARPVVQHVGERDEPSRIGSAAISRRMRAFSSLRLFAAASASKCWLMPRRRSARGIGAAQRRQRQ